MRVPDVIRGFDILCLGSQDWNTHRNVPHQTMGRLAAGNRVLYVNVPRSFVRGGKRAEGGYGAAPAQRLERVDADAGPVWVYAPPAVFLPVHSLPGPLFTLASTLNGALLAWLLRGVMRSLAFDTPLLWIYGFSGAALLGRIDCRMLIYDCIDHFPGYLEPGTVRDNVARSDETLCRQSDMVFAGSRSLLALKDGFNRNTHLVPHAADFVHFHKAALAETPLPADIAVLPKPVIGLAGVLDKRVDLAVIAGLAETHPEWSIALVGPVWDSLDVSGIGSRPNVHLLGRKSVADLPGYIKAFDVCIVPYIIDDFTRNIYPLKLHEYLASGRPVVASPVPAIVEHEGVVRIADGVEAFVREVEGALGENDPDLVARRIGVARSNTWEHRVAAKSEYVAAALRAGSR